MIRLSELRLPLAALPLDPEQHPDTALHALAAQTLGLAPEAIATLRVHKRSFDARKAELLAVFIVDLTLTEPEREPALLARFEKNPHIQPTPDMRWQPPVHAPSGFGQREGERRQASRRCR